MGNSVTNFEVVSKPVFLEGVEIPDRKALVRTDTNEYLSVVGYKYHVVQNHEFFGPLEAEMKKTKELKDFMCDEAIDDNGLTCFRDYTFNTPETRLDMPAGTQSDLRFRIIARNSHGLYGMAFISGAIDMFCMNGCISGIYSVEHLRHTPGVVRTYGKAVEQIMQAYAGFKDSGARWHAYAATPVTDKAVDMYISNHPKLTGPAKDAIMFQFRKEAAQRGRTLWSLYSAITHYASHSDVKNPSREHASVLHRIDRMRAVIENEEEFMTLAA